MRDLGGKTALITGGASGIGLAMAEAFAGAGMNIMIADIDANAMEAAKARLSAIGPKISTVACDVTDPASTDQAASEVTKIFGKLHLVCNNAGVYATGTLDTINLADWRWVMDVNFMGMVHSVKSFVPLLQQHGEGGHVVNTCSHAGLTVSSEPGAFAPYAPSKYAAVALSEKLAVELAPFNIGVSLLCPYFVRTNLHESDSHRPDRYRTGAGDGNLDRLAGHLQKAMDTAVVARHVLRAVQDNELYIFTHLESRAQIEQRFRRILASFDRLAGTAV